jgi:hypothetical protein
MHQYYDAPYDNALVDAVENGCELGVRLLLSEEDGARADSLDGEALLRACSYGKTNIVRILLNAETAPRADIRDSLALVYACNGGHVGIIKLLLESKFPPSVNCNNGQVLLDAVLLGKTDVVQMIVKAGIHKKFVLKALYKRDREVAGDPVGKVLLDYLTYSSAYDIFFGDGK